MAKAFVVVSAFSANAEDDASTRELIVEMRRFFLGGFAVLSSVWVHGS